VVGDWATFAREFGLPITMLFTFVTAIVSGLLVAGKSVESERNLTSERLADWKQRAADEHERAVAAEARLDQALPALALATEQLRTAREDLARRPARRA